MNTILLKEGFNPKPNPKIKTITNVLLMQKQPKLLTNDDVRTSRDQNKLKRKPKSSTQDKVLQMNMKNTNLGCLEKVYCQTYKLIF